MADLDVQRWIAALFQKAETHVILFLERERNPGRQRKKETTASEQWGLGSSLGHAHGKRLTQQMSYLVGPA